jgi:hypothetical protein
VRSFAVVVNDCATPQVHAPIAIRTMDTDYGQRNFTLRFDDLAAGLPDVLSLRQLDWLEILGFLFATDLACERGRGDVEWARDIQVWFPVREPDFWFRHAVAFQEIFASLTADRLEIRFEPAQDPAPPPRQSRTAFPDHDSVALISGGMDSFVGVAEYVRGGGRPLLMSRPASGAENTAQADAEQVLRQWHGDLVRVRVSAGKARGGTFPPPDPSQRSRTFLFVGAASLVAVAGGSGRVLLNENGIMALHLPLTPARLGGLSTRTASPPILARIRTLASDALGSHVSVENPIVGLTKPEVAELALNGGYATDLMRTVSCWSIGRTREHCGICPPCLMRRISCLTHGIPDVPYKADALDDRNVLRDETAQDNIAHFVGLIDELKEMSDLELQFAYPELLNGGPALTFGQVVELHRRWANQADAVLSAHAVPALVR